MNSPRELQQLLQHISTYEHMPKGSGHLLAILMTSGVADMNLKTGKLYLTAKGQRLAQVSQ
jgi:hypothetical protein